MAPSSTDIIRRSCRQSASALLERGELPVPLIRKNEGGWKPQRQWANADPDKCREWVQDPNVYWAGLAVVTTGLVVIDVDIKNGGRADDLPDIAHLDRAPQIITPSGGRHYYFTLPPGPDANSRIGWRPYERYW